MTRAECKADARRARIDTVQYHGRGGNVLFTCVRATTRGYTRGYTVEAVYRDGKSFSPQFIGRVAAIRFARAQAASGRYTNPKHFSVRCGTAKARA